MDKKSVIRVAIIIGCLLLIQGNVFSQTIDELKITVKQLEAKNNSLETKLKKCQKGKKNGAESEQRILQLEEENRQLQREIILLKGKEEKNDDAEIERAKKTILDIQDPYFTSYLLRYCDMDDDGVITQFDADNTFVIDLSKEKKGGLIKEEVYIDLEGLKYYKSLKRLACSGNNILRLDLSNNPELETLLANNCGLKKLDISKNKKLKRIECSGNALYELDLNNNQSLSVINVSKNQLDALNVSNCNHLTSLRCADNSIITISFDNNVLLKTLDCSNNKLSQLSLVNNTAIDSVICQKNNLVFIDIRNGQDIPYLDCSKNKNLEFVYISDGHRVIMDKKDMKVYYK